MQKEKRGLSENDTPATGRGTMTVTDGEFFEEFKRLERACGKLNGETHAVSRYIDDMRSVEDYGRARLDRYEADLKTLIYLRKLRNVLAHESKEGVCTVRDTERLREFCGRVEGGTDPLSLLKGIAEREKTEGNIRAAGSSVRTYYPSDTYYPSGTYYPSDEAVAEKRENAFSQAETFSENAGSGVGLQSVRCSDGGLQSVRCSGGLSQNGGASVAGKGRDEKPFRKELSSKTERAVGTEKKKKADKSMLVVMLCVAALVAISFGALLIARVLQ